MDYKCNWLKRQYRKYFKLLVFDFILGNLFKKQSYAKEMFLIQS